MKHSWETYKIGEVFERQFDSFHISDIETYKRITIKTRGQGISLRDRAQGMTIGTKRQFRVKKDQFLLSKIDALNGAFGIVPEECDEGIITGNFWTFNYNTKILSKDYLNFLCIGQIFTEFSRLASSGSTNRKYLDQEKFLSLKISLPPLEEQQQIVVKLEKVREHSEKIRKLRSKQEQDIDNLLYSEYLKIIKDVPWNKMQDIAPITRRPVEIKPDGEYPELGIRSFGKGTFHKPALTRIEVGTKKLYQIKAGDLMFSNVFAWEGAIAVAKEKDNDRVGSHRFISCVLDLEQVQPHFLCYHFLSPKGMEDINRSSPGGAGRNKTLGLKKLENIDVPVPSIEKQQEFEALQRQLRQLKEHHKETLQNLDKLFPALLDKAFKGELVETDKETLMMAAEPENSHQDVPIANPRPNQKKRSEKSDAYVRKMVLAAEIANQLHSEPTFGHVKFMKLLYLCGEAGHMKLMTNYQKFAAGPFDGRLINSVDTYFKKQKWFRVEQVNTNGYKRYTYYPDINVEKYKHLYDGYFLNQQHAISEIIELFRKKDSKHSKIVATLYAVWNNRIIQQQDISDELLIEDFYKWDKQKAKYERERLEKALDWMRNEGIVPDGWGKVIEKAKKKNAK